MTPLSSCSHWLSLGQNSRICVRIVCVKLVSKNNAAEINMEPGASPKRPASPCQSRQDLTRERLISSLIKTPQLRCSKAATDPAWTLRPQKKKDIYQARPPTAPTSFDLSGAFALLLRLSTAPVMEFKLVLILWCSAVVYSGWM